MNNTRNTQPEVLRHSEQTAALAYGARVRAARKRAGLNQRQMAAVTGISQTMISHIESQRRVVTIPELLKIAAGLGATIGTLTGTSPVRDRLTYAARSEDPQATATLQDRLAFYLEMDAHFADRRGHHQQQEPDSARRHRTHA